MNIAESYMRRYPNARASTILQKQKCQQVADQIKREIEAEDFRRVDRIMSKMMQTFPLIVKQAEKRGKL